MSKVVSYGIIFVCAMALVTVSLVKPYYISDQNEFLKNFVNHEFVNILGVILAITLASVANIHLAFNRIEEIYQRRGALQNSRRNLTQSAYWLIGLFIGGFVVVSVKPIACGGMVSQALFNSISIIILLWHILILIDLTRLIFRIEPEIDNH